VVLAFSRPGARAALALLRRGGYCFWILYCRVVLEVLAAIFRMAAAIAPERSTTEHQ
jgi:hypothetical protein